MKMQSNPYVGPRTFLREEGHLFFGRARESSDLIALVASEQSVLFYAQSGAGKSSLINARIIPELLGREFEVLPIGRVGGDPPLAVEPPNIYLYNLERSLVQHDVNAEARSSLSLTSFLAGLDRDEQGYFFTETPKPARREEEDLPRRRVLIIDQFEEFFSTHPEAWPQREGFFRELAQVMKDHPALSILLIIREDYVASLDPYTHLLPGGLRMRYSMQRLSREAAVKAIRSPVEKPRPYAEGVAEKLAEDLSRVKVQKPDGTTGTEPGQYIEPVQLQVVCYSLWENLPSEGTQITEKDVQDVGDVNQSLERYYDQRVSEVARAKHVRERQIRDWFDQKLITAGGIRNMVLQERETPPGGLDDDVIQALQSDLVRAEKRGGATWYELTHDRLVEPVLASNKKWFELNLSPLQRQATLWQDQGQSDKWLLTSEALAEIERWAKDNRDDLTETEREFLDASRTQDLRLNRDRRQRRILLLSSLIAITLSSILMVLFFTTIMATGDPTGLLLLVWAAGPLLVGYWLGRYRSR
jgi:hypothetical protein